MRLLQSADLHVDSPMKGLVAYEQAPVDELRLATRVALSNLVEAAIEVALMPSSFRATSLTATGGITARASILSRRWRVSVTQKSPW